MQTINLYEDIGPGLAQRVLGALLPGPVEIRINSYGGSVAEAITLAQRLIEHPGAVTLVVDGVCASAASLLLAAGRAVAAPGALVMIHGPHVETGGNAGELRQTADALDQHAEAMVALYARKVPAERIRPLLLDGADHWFTAAEALDFGLIDDISGDGARLDVAALARLNAPARFLMTDTNRPATTTPPGAHSAEVAAFVAHERDRRREVRALFARLRDRPGVVELLDQCLDDTECTPTAAGARLLAKLGEGAQPINGPHALAPDAYGHTAPPITNGANLHHAEFLSAAADAILARHGVRVKTPHPAARDLVSASITDMASTLLGHRGRTADRFSRAELVRAAITSSDLPALLENVAHKSAMIGFQETEAASHRRWTRQGTLPDFKTASRVALSEAPGLALVPEGGEYQHGALIDAKQTIRLDTYGRIVSLSRQALVNDDLGELVRLPQALGQAAARLEAEQVYGLLTDNPAMRDGVALFHATHGNVGTAGALALATLAELRKLIRVQRGLAGEGAMNLTPRFLIVPAALETAAEQLIASIVPATSANAVPDWVRQLEVVVDARLDDHSVTGFYLAAAPDAADTVEVARLDGQQPAIEQQNDFNTDALSFKVRLDVGAAVLDWRGLAYNAGA